MTIVAYGTSTPELAASMAAVVGSHTDLILGNVVGSNISNIGMVIGVCAVVSTLVVKKATTRKEVPIMIGATLLLIAMSVDGEISQYDGDYTSCGIDCIYGLYVVKGKKRKE